MFWTESVRPAFGPAAQLCYVGVAVAATLVLTARRRRLDPGEPR